MEVPALVTLLLLSCSSLKMVSAQQPTSSNIAVEQPASGGEANPTANNAAGSGAKIPVPDVEEATGEDSLSGCKKLCNEGCDNIPDECEWVAGAIPVLCGEKREQCMKSCETFCDCQFACGCRAAEGCDDLCSQACKSKKEVVIEELAQTTNTPSPNAKGPNDLPVVYKKSDGDDQSGSEED